MAWLSMIATWSALRCTVSLSMAMSCVLADGTLVPCGSIHRDGDRAGLEPDGNRLEDRQGRTFEA